MVELIPESPDLPSAAETNDPRVPFRLHALKDGDTFLVADSYGDVVGEADGLFHNDTRILSGFRLLIGDARPSLLSAAVSRDNVFFTSHLTNRPLPPLGGRSIPEGVIHIERTRFLWTQRLFERISSSNYGGHDAVLPLVLMFDADFRDMFEVRGLSRPRRGRLEPPVAEQTCLVFGYQGLDGVRRRTRVTFSQAPSRLEGGMVEFQLPLKADGAAELYLEVSSDGGDETPGEARFRHEAASARRSIRSRIRRGAWPRSSGRLFNEWLEKSRADLALLVSELPTGPYPYAGIPWFSTAFGRDAIITALQTLWIDQSLARGVLTFLARNQAREASLFQDAEPGKIMHETRKGEMTALGEIPFGKYYGGVDTTPLFIVLAGAYAERTGDLDIIDGLWPALRAATAWMESISDTNPDGFLVYARGERTGLANQGWKDSEDSIFHADGRFPVGPIAVVEVQGYMFTALRAMADLATRRGEDDLAGRWRRRAETLRLAVERRFWMEDAGFYGIAIDGEGELCRVLASNAGHLLFCGLPDPARARRVSQHLMSRSFDTGWGLRTLAPGQPHFNPMSYHNGSVWPHDTALCVSGLARYGERDRIVTFTNEGFETAVHFDMRLPELFCGFERAPGEPPIAYPVACLPQAWAAGSVFMLLQACLGLRIDGWRGEVHIDRPRLPVGIDQLVVRGLAVKGQTIDLVFQRLEGRIVASLAGEGANPVPILVHM